MALLDDQPHAKHVRLCPTVVVSTYTYLLSHCCSLYAQPLEATTPCNTVRLDPAFATTDAFLMLAGNKLVLAFRGTEPLLSTAWLTDFADAQPAPDADNAEAWRYGYFHTGFKQALGLDKWLAPLDHPQAPDHVRGFR